jgi:hypothetical protein
VTNSKNFCLSDADDRFLVRFSRSIKGSKIYYFSIGLALCWAAVIFGLAIKRHDHRLVGSSIFLGAIAVQLILISQKFRRLHSIITQMQEHIAKLEGDERLE